MINIEIEAKLPDLSKFEFTSTFDKIAKHLELSIKKNFAEGGRPNAWKAKKKDGSPSHLFINGMLFNTIGSDSGEDYAEAGAMAILPYSWIHQMGFSGVRRDGRRMEMPKRPYILFQQDDIEFCLEQMAGDIVRFWDTSGEVIQ